MSSPDESATDWLAFAERNLWCAVIEQALTDIGVVQDPRGVRLQTPSPFSAEYKDALRWLFYEKSDFLFVCMMAGISPTMIRAVARRSRALL